MPRQIHANLPVKVLPRRVEFFTKLGLKFNLWFTGKNAACMIAAANVCVMHVPPLEEPT